MKLAFIWRQNFVRIKFELTLEKGTEIKIDKRKIYKEERERHRLTEKTRKIDKEEEKKRGRERKKKIGKEKMTKKKDRQRES